MEGPPTGPGHLTIVCVKASVKQKFPPCTAMWERNKVLVFYVSQSQLESSSCLISHFHYITPLCSIFRGHLSSAPGIHSSK